jgi:hypothetical protein
MAVAGSKRKGSLCTGFTRASIFARSRGPHDAGSIHVRVAEIAGVSHGTILSPLREMGVEIRQGGNDA